MQVVVCGPVLTLRCSTEQKLIRYKTALMQQYSAEDINDNESAMNTCLTQNSQSSYLISYNIMAYVAEFTSDLRHMAGADNVVVDCISRPPEELYLPRSTQVASLKAPSGSLAAPVARDGSSGASTAAAAVVPATQRGPSGGQSCHVSS